MNHPLKECYFHVYREDTEGCSNYVMSFMNEYDANLMSDQMQRACPNHFYHWVEFDPTFWNE